MILTIDLPEHLYLTGLTLLRDLLASDGSGDPEEPRVLEARLRKRTWTGERAVDDAAAMLVSVADPAWRLVELFLDSPDLRLTELELATRLDIAQGTATSYRGLLGKQSWRHGERLNPISSDTSTKPAVLYMRPETHAVFATAHAIAKGA